MPDVLRCPNCGSEVAPLRVVTPNGRGPYTAIVDDLTGTEIIVARVRCGACGGWAWFRSKKVEVAQAMKSA
jgi:uncharacterized Zn finger protein